MYFIKKKYILFHRPRLPSVNIFFNLLPVDVVRAFIFCSSPVNCTSCFIYYNSMGRGLRGHISGKTIYTRVLLDIAVPIETEWNTLYIFENQFTRSYQYILVHFIYEYRMAMTILYGVLVYIIYSNIYNLW